MYMESSLGSLNLCTCMILSLPNFPQVPPSEFPKSINSTFTTNFNALKSTTKFQPNFYILRTECAISPIMLPSLDLIGSESQASNMLITDPRLKMGQCGVHILISTSLNALPWDRLKCLEIIPLSYSSSMLMRPLSYLFSTRIHSISTMTFSRPPHLF